MSATLAVQGLHTSFHTRAGIVPAVRDVSFEVAPGSVLGIVGESGSGKSVTAYSIMRLVDPPGRIESGRILFKGRDLLALDEEAMRAVRGAGIAMIFQDPMGTLNPVVRIESQMIEAIQYHEPVSHARALERAREALGRVGIDDPAARLRAYPHELSGGMRQRVVIAIALLNRPSLIIADEPTTALDVTIQNQILGEVESLVRETGTALIWITHDLSVVAGLADRICVMYAGRIVESGSVRDVLEQPKHPYTAGLIASVPSRNTPGLPLKQIPGVSPSLLRLGPGCSFVRRCARASARCNEPPASTSDALGGRTWQCWHPIESGR